MKPGIDRLVFIVLYMHLEFILLSNAYSNRQLIVPESAVLNRIYMHEITKSPSGLYVNFSCPQAGLTTKVQNLRTPDGLILESILIMRTLKLNPSKRTVVLLHGAQRNMSIELEYSCRFAETTNSHVMLFDFRGYGGSQGTPSYDGITMDMQTVLHFVQSYDHRIISPKEIYFYGLCLGGAFAIRMLHYYRQTDEIAGSIIENTFASLGTIAARHMSNFYGFFTNHFAPRVWLNSKFLPEIDQRVLFISGSRDRHTPPQEMRTLFNMIPMNVEKWWFTAVNCSHVSAPTAKDYFPTIKRFLDRDVQIQIPDKL